MDILITFTNKIATLEQFYNPIVTPTKNSCLFLAILNIPKQ